MGAPALGGNQVNDQPLRMIGSKPDWWIRSVLDVSGLLLTGLLNILVGIFWTVESFRYQDWGGLRVLAIPMVIVGGLTLLAARVHRSLGDRAGYLILLSLIGQLLVISDTDLLLAYCFLIAQFVILPLLAVRFRSSTGIKIILMGFVLAGVSYFIYQRMGPAIGVHGNECGEPPNHLCYGPVLGAGFPMQYVIDTPLISVPGSLGWEDDFRGVSLALDIFVYSAAIFGSYKLVQILRYHRKRVAESSANA